MKPNYRRCVSCRHIALKEFFWRIVRVYPSRQVQLDQGMGRSAYICRSMKCIKEARQKNRLGRALKVPFPDDIYQLLAERMATIPQQHSSKNE